MLQGCGKDVHVGLHQPHMMCMDDAYPEPCVKLCCYQLITPYSDLFSSCCNFAHTSLIRVIERDPKSP